MLTIPTAGFNRSSRQHVGTVGHRCRGFFEPAEALLEASINIDADGRAAGYELRQRAVSSA